MKKQFPIISFEHASFQYEGQSQESLKDVKLIIKSGEFLVITGQSGCGKTTLTRCINNLIPRFFEGRLSGEVIVLGRSIKESDAGEAGKEIASIFQDPRSQFFTTNSSSEVAFACENYGIPHKEIVKRVNSAFQSLNMENLKDRDIFALSSGERQKVAFLAATTLNPQIYVLDEPSANLDIHTILQVREILSALKAAGHTIIVSEHRLFYLYGLADRFLIMEDGQICEELTGEEMAELSAVQMHNRRLRPLNLDLIHILKSEGNLTMSGRFCERPAGYATQMQRNTGTSLDMRARRGCERNGKKRREKKRAASGSITSPGRRPSCFLMSGCQTSLPVQK